MTFEFATAGRIVFGPGSLGASGPLLAAFGRRALVVTGRASGRAAPLLEILEREGVSVRVFGVTGEPRISDAAAGAELARAEAVDLVIGFGGGSAVDAGKAVAALATNPGDPLEHLEVVGRGRPLRVAPLPYVAIPTTAGTGAEATRNAVLASPEHGVKVSLRSPLMLPRLAVVDPTLAVGLPAALTASTGLDALTQLIEPYLSCRANPITDAFCREGIPRVARSLRRACAEPGDLGAREDLALGSLLSGLALANAGLGAVHGFAAPVGGAFPAPHGAVCAALLPGALEVNRRALALRQPQSPALARLAEIGRWLTGRADAGADDAVEWVRELVRELGIPGLRAYGVGASDVSALCARAAEASSMKGNPLPLLPVELEAILASGLDGSWQPR